MFLMHRVELKGGSGLLGMGIPSPVRFLMHRVELKEGLTKGGPPWILEMFLMHRVELKVYPLQRIALYR